MKTALFLALVAVCVLFFVASSDATGPCVHARDFYACNAIPECFWDVDDVRCEERNGDATAGHCGTFYSDPNSCNADGACFWDVDDFRCEQRA